MKEYMNVKELKEFLNEFPDEAIVNTETSNHYNVDGIRCATLVNSGDELILFLGNTAHDNKNNAEYNLNDYKFIKRKSVYFDNGYMTNKKWCILKSTEIRLNKLFSNAIICFNVENRIDNWTNNQGKELIEILIYPENTRVKIIWKDTIDKLNDFDFSESIEILSNSGDELWYQNVINGYYIWSSDNVHIESFSKTFNIKIKNVEV
uniref:Uncharacterized protein n=1 Tax=viral metagenome TaxID=1070528 RepID=A0A6M3XKJ8_9ZZZZ